VLVFGFAGLWVTYKKKSTFVTHGPAKQPAAKMGKPTPVEMRPDMPVKVGQDGVEIGAVRA